MNSRARHYALLVLVGGVVFFLNLGVPPLWDRDEPRNAGCALEMLERNDWVVPTFNGELRAHKPVLLYWLIMISYRVFGVGEFAARFGSALCGLGTVLLTYEIGRRLFDARVACWAGIVLASTVMFGVAARAATPDSVLIFCGTLALAIFVLGTFSRNGAAHVLAAPESPLLVIAMYGAMGLGVLAKGPIGALLPMAVIGMYLLIVRLPCAEPHSRREETDESEPVVQELSHSEGSSCATAFGPRPSVLFTRAAWRRVLWLVRPFAPGHFWRVFWSMHPVAGLLSALAVFLPWYLWVTLRTEGVWTRDFLLQHNLSRALVPMEGHSGPAILFYVAAILVGFFPWSVLTVATARRVAVCMGRRECLNQRHAMTFLLCWVGVYLGLFSLAQTKLPSYVTPCYPALALLVAYFMSHWSSAAVEDSDCLWIRIGLASLLLAGGGLGIGVGLAARHFAPGCEWMSLAGGAPVVGSLVCWRWLARGQQDKAVGGMAATAVVFCILVLGLLPVELGKRQRYGVLLGAARSHPGPVVAFGHLEPSWVFYGGRSIRFFPEHDVEGFVRFVSRNSSTSIITTPQQLGRLSDELSVELDVMASTDYFLRNRQLVLARPRATAAAAGSMGGATRR